jgi:hypothetical protein
MYMRTRPFLAVITFVSFAVAACGGEGSSPVPATAPPPDSTLPAPAPEPDAADGFDHPGGADDVVLRIGFDGGFVTAEIDFQDLPLLLVTGDGRLFQPGPVMAIYPGPLLPNMQVRDISEAGIDHLLALADHHGLLSPREYERPDMIADASDTVVTIDVGDGPIEHRAYALGMGEGPDGLDTDPARIALGDFVREATEYVTAPANDQLGPEEAFEPDAYLVRSLIAGDSSGEEELTVIDWPADVSVRLDGEIDCAEIAADEVGELFAGSNQLTVFAEDGMSYRLLVAPRLPGSSCS